MYAALGAWSMQAGNQEEQERSLHENVIPMVKTMPGFVSGHWMSDETGSKTYTLIVFENEEAAQGFASFVLGDMRQGEQAKSGIKNESMTVLRVSAEARM